MLTDSRPRIPMKGPILVYTGIALALAAFGHFAQKQTGRLEQAQSLQEKLATGELSPNDIPPLDLGRAGDLEDQLAPYMPMAGFGASDLLDLDDAIENGSRRGAGDAPNASYLMSAEQLRERRGGSYVYPSFDVRGRHGAPLRSTARNVLVQLVDAHDEPIVATLLRVVQTGYDGEYEPNAYRSMKDPTYWTIGSPMLTPGADATFELTAQGEGGEFFMITRVRRVPELGDVDLGAVRMGRRSAPVESDAD